MELIISGICCWVDATPPKAGKTVIIRNALSGGAHRGARIPPHYAFIHAKRHQVDDSRWRPDFWTDDDVFFWLTGDRLTIDPMPRGAAVDLRLLPHVASAEVTDPICPGAEEIRPGFCDEPATSRVLALLDVPPDADVISATTQRGAAFAALRIPSAPVTITATPFADSIGVARSLTITDPSAQCFIVNVNMPEYISGLGADDDEHKYLVCEIFRPQREDARALASVLPVHAFTAAIGEIPSYSYAELNEMGDGSVTPMRHARGMTQYLDTLAAGCSASQWP